MTYPTHFLCIGAFNPCPCGYYGHPDKPCKDTDAQINRYQAKLSGPFRDRFDIHLEVPVPKFEELHLLPSAESSQDVKKRVEHARARQRKRYGSDKTNNQMTLSDLENFARLNANCLTILKQAIELNHFSARAMHRITKVARTIADLEGVEEIGDNHLLEAIQYRG